MDKKFKTDRILATELRDGWFIKVEVKGGPFATLNEAMYHLTKHLSGDGQTEF